MKYKKIKTLVLKNLTILIPLILLPLLYIVLYKFYIPRINAFGCFDDCFNYLGGYFIANGKTIYSDFFFNHQILPPFISFLIQQVTVPENIFELLLRHRQFLLFWAFAFNVILIIRFRLSAFFMILIFEFSKFYIFGDRFLAEPLIVYPTIYLFGLALEKLTTKKLYTIDYFLASIFAWFIIFSREPYVPLAIFLFVTIFWGRLDKTKKYSLGLLVLLSLLITPLFNFNFKEYFYNLASFNYQAIILTETPSGMFGPTILQMFFYPLYIFFYGPVNLFKQLLLGLNMVFLAYYILVLFKKKWLIALFIFVSLGLANIRVVVPGDIFYASFHLILWYAIFLFSIFYLVLYFKKIKILFALSFCLIFISFGLFITSNSYFAYENVDQQKEFIGNYGYILQEGEVIKALSSKNDTLYLDGSDDLIYWQAKILSPYKYVWYTSQMPQFEKYTTERLNMFKKNPPTFYREHGTCPKDAPAPENYRLPSSIEQNYIRLYNLGKPSCLFIKRSKLPDITPEQWTKAEEFLFHLPKDENINTTTETN